MPVHPTNTNTNTKNFARHGKQAVLKLVGTPVEMLAERFQIMWPDGGAHGA
jgi:hypothetical protein